MQCLIQQYSENQTTDLETEMEKRESLSNVEKRVLEQIIQNCKQLHLESLLKVKKLSAELVEEERSNGALKGPKERFSVKGVYDDMKNLFQKVTEDTTEKNRDSIEYITRTNKVEIECVTSRKMESTEPPASSQELEESVDKKSEEIDVACYDDKDMIANVKAPEENISKISEKFFEQIANLKPGGSLGTSQTSTSVSPLESSGTFNKHHSSFKDNGEGSPDSIRVPANLQLKKVEIDMRACAPLPNEDKSEVSNPPIRGNSMIEDDSQIEWHKPVYDRTAFQDKLAEKLERHEEKMRKLRKEIEDCEQPRNTLFAERNRQNGGDI